MVDVQMKWCKGCGEEKPATGEYFYVRRASKDGLCTRCKKCSAVKSRAYYQANKVRVIERSLVYYRANREARLKGNRQYRLMHPEKKRDDDRLYREKHREALRIRAKRYDWYSKNQEQAQSRSRLYKKAHRTEERAREHRRRARKLAAEGSYSKQDIELLYSAQRGRCWYCGIELHSKYQIDHRVPLTRGGSNNPSNLVLTCGEKTPNTNNCNQKKNNKLPHEFNGRLL